MLIGRIEVGRYGKLTRFALAISFGSKGSPTSVTCHVENILGNNDTLAATLALTKEEEENNYNEFWVEPLQYFLICQVSQTGISQLPQRRDVI